MKQVLYVLVLLTSAWLLYLNNRTTTGTSGSEETYNVSCTDADSQLMEELLICIAYTENFYAEPYFCGAKWTAGYGSTIDVYGNRITPSYGRVSKEFAKQCVFTHLRKRVFPYVRRYVKRPLTKSEFLGCCLFVYGAGNGNFAKSAFLKAVNRGETPYQCARKMTGFTKSAGKRANGLLKRYWIVGAIYCGYLTPSDLKQMRPAGMYNYNVAYFYHKGCGDEDGFWSYDFSAQKIKRFCRENYSGYSVAHII